jgi:Protein of unknown function (DUF5132)
MWFYLLGVITAPLLTPVLKPIMRGIVKTAVVLGEEAKTMAASVREDYSDMAAEARSTAAAAKAPTLAE